MKFTEVAKTTEFVKGELDGKVAILTMNRPKAMNALNDQTLGELDAFFTAIAEDEDVLGVIITGNGKAFVAGADISQMQSYGYSVHMGIDRNGRHPVTFRKDDISAFAAYSS